MANSFSGVPAKGTPEPLQLKAVRASQQLAREISGRQSFQNDAPISRDDA
jgi:hypothetical protein